MPRTTLAELRPRVLAASRTTGADIAAIAARLDADPTLVGRVFDGLFDQGLLQVRVERGRVVRRISRRAYRESA